MKLILGLMVFLGVQGAYADLNDQDIVNGTLVGEESPLAKTVVGLLTSDGGLCTATLVGKGVAITAAHCVVDAGPSTKMVLTRGAKVRTPKERVRVLSYAYHKKFSMQAVTSGGLLTAGWDVAVLTYEEFEGGHVAAQMAGSSSKLSKGQAVTLAGYGITGDDEDDSGVLRTSKTKVSNPALNATDLTLPGDHGTCQGDSGGPVFVSSGGKLVLVGITSRGMSCASDGIYTSVSRVRKDIDELLKASPQNPSKKWIGAKIAW